MEEIKGKKLIQRRSSFDVDIDEETLTMKTVEYSTHGDWFSLLVHRCDLLVFVYRNIQDRL
jgi:hypothetical protein